MVTIVMIDYKRATVGYSALPGGCDLNFYFYFLVAWQHSHGLNEGDMGPTAKGTPRERHTSRSTQQKDPSPLPLQICLILIINYLHCQIRICVSCLFGETGASIMGVQEPLTSKGTRILL